VNANGNGPRLLARYGQNEREIALGRKNHLFAGSDGGARRWAIVVSLIATARLNGIEPFAYLNDVLERLSNGHPNRRLDELLPWNWKPTKATY
jgi:transposase